MKHYPVQFINLENGETIAYRHAGSMGKTVLLVHGNMSSSVHFQVVLEQLEDSYQVYALDLRGFGDSSYHKPLNTLHDFADDVKLFINALNLDDIYMLGWSTGGGIILEVAADIPHKIKKVFLLDSVGLQGYPMFKKDAKGQPILSKQLSSRKDIAADPVQVAPILQAYKTNDRDLLKAVWNAAIYNLNQPNIEDYELYLDAIFKQRNLVDVDYSLVHFNMTHESNGVEEGSGRMDNVLAPIIIMHGAKDLVVPIDYAKQMEALFKEQALLVIFENAGHSVITDDLDLFIKAFKKYI